MQPQYCPVQTPSTNSLKDSLFAPFAKLGVYGGLSGIKVQDRAVPESRPARDLATLSYPTEGITPFWTPRLFNECRLCNTLRPRHQQGEDKGMKGAGYILGKINN